MSSTTIARSEIAGAEAVPLLGLVNYQQGSVVSRVILKRERGTSQSLLSMRDKD